MIFAGGRSISREVIVVGHKNTAGRREVSSKPSWADDGVFFCNLGHRGGGGL